MPPQGRADYLCSITPHPTHVEHSRRCSILPKKLHFNRCIVRERDPTFHGSFVEGCLLVVGKIVGVWKNFISVSPPSPQRHASVADSVGDVGLDDQERGSAVTDMLDFLRPHGLVTHARISAQEAFWYAGQTGVGGWKGRAEGERFCMRFRRISSRLVML